MIKINNKEIEIDLFPNNELLLKTDYLNTLEEPFNINFSFYNNQDILELLFVLAHLDDIGQADYNLFIHYMPYSRMDRNENGNCFSLKHICDLINRFLSCDSDVYIVEPHSDVTLNLLDAKRVNVITPLTKHILSKQPDINMICYPDKGAKQRFQDNEVKLPVVFCNKVRDFDTGNIIGLELDGDINVKDKNILILDDLCSKGGTFYHTANKLKENGAKNIYLGLCHIEHTIEKGELLKENSPIKHIYGLNTMLNKFNFNDKITIYDIEQFLNTNKFEEVKYE